MLKLMRKFLFLFCLLSAGLSFFYIEFNILFTFVLSLLMLVCFLEGKDQKTREKDPLNSMNYLIGAVIAFLLTIVILLMRYNNS